MTWLEMFLNYVTGSYPEIRKSWHMLEEDHGGAAKAPVVFLIAWISVLTERKPHSVI